jgi:hypothetical protein
VVFMLAASEGSSNRPVFRDRRECAARGLGHEAFVVSTTIVQLLDVRLRRAGDQEPLGSEPERPIVGEIACGISVSHEEVTMTGYFTWHHRLMENHSGQPGVRRMEMAVATTRAIGTQPERRSFASSIPVSVVAKGCASAPGW